jgi:hypothetical protein
MGYDLVDFSGGKGIRGTGAAGEYEPMRVLYFQGLR